MFDWSGHCFVRLHPFTDIVRLMLNEDSRPANVARNSVTGAVWNVIQRNYSRDLFEVHGERAPKPWRRSEQADVKLEAQLAERIAYGRSLVVGRGVHRWQGMEDRYIYSQVEVNGVVYRAGECVAVHAPKKGASKKASIDSVVCVACPFELFVLMSVSALYSYCTLPTSRKTTIGSCTASSSFTAIRPF